MSDPGPLVKEYSARLQDLTQKTLKAKHDKNDEMYSLRRDLLRFIREQEEAVSFRMARLTDRRKGREDHVKMQEKELRAARTNEKRAPTAGSASNQNSKIMLIEADLAVNRVEIDKIKAVYNRLHDLKERLYWDFQRAKNVLKDGKGGVAVCIIS